MRIIIVSFYEWEVLLFANKNSYHDIFDFENDSYLVSVLVLSKSHTNFHFFQEISIT